MTPRQAYAMLAAALTRLVPFILLVGVPGAGAGADQVLSPKYEIGVEGGGWMNFVSFSPDGKLVLSNGGIPGKTYDRLDRRILAIWSFPEGKYVRSVSHAALPPNYPGSMTPEALAVSADWRLVATDQAIIDVQTDRPVLMLGKRFSRLADAAFSPDGRYLAFVREPLSLQDPKTTIKPRKQIFVLSTADGTVVKEFGRRYTSALAIHPDGRTLASGHWDNITLWDMFTGERLALLRGFGRYVSGIAFSKDGSLIAANTDAGGMQIWDVAGRTRLRSVAAGDLSTPAFSPDGKLVATGSYYDGSVSLVEVSTGKVLTDIKVSMFGCGLMAFSPDGRYLVTPSNGGQIGGWPVDSGRKRFETGGTIRVFEVGPNPASQPTPEDGAAER